MAEGLRIAVVGAESTGKTTLAEALAAELAQGRAGVQGLRVAWVGEVLRDWCARTGRTPQAHEQAAILKAQHERIDTAAARHDIVVCDTTGLMTAVYSRLIFGDGALDARALQWHRRVALTLLTAIDLPWVADGHQRDGPQVREPVDALLRQILLQQRLPFAVVGGTGAARTAQAVAAVAPLLRGPAAGAAGGQGRFARLADGSASHGEAGHGAWSCECCVPEAERTLMDRRNGVA